MIANTKHNDWAEKEYEAIVSCFIVREPLYCLVIRYFNVTISSNLYTVELLCTVSNK